MSLPTLKNLHEAYVKKVDALQGNASFKTLEHEVRRSVDNFVFQKARTESKMFDEAWVNALDTMPSHILIKSLKTRVTSLNKKATLSSPLWRNV
jgi:hypothetical protein